MDIVVESDVPETIDVSSRKRKRNRRKQPFKDIELKINVKANVITTASTTLRHSTTKYDSVSKTSGLKLFKEPSHSNCTGSMTRQFGSRPMSNKLLQLFKRMTLTKTEETNHNMVQEFCSDQRDDNAPVISMPSVENSIVDAVPTHGNELSLQMAEFSVVGG